MRGTRWLILVAIVLVAAGVGGTYYLQRKMLREQAPAKPGILPLELNSSAEDWKWTQTAGPRTVVEITAKKFGQVKDSSRVDLEQVELHIFHKDGASYDRVKSAQAQFSTVDRKLYSEGEVEITLGVPVEGQPTHVPVSIHSSGVTFDSTTGKASTDRPTRFSFQNGTGTAVGGSYDPGSKELHMNSQVELDWKSPKPGAKPMKLNAAELTYKEGESKVWLQPWARLSRENTQIEAGPTVVTLEDGQIRLVEASKAHGMDRYPQRQLQYAAEQLRVDFAAGGEVEKIRAEGNARLVSTAENSETALTADRVDMDFTATAGGSVLTRAQATGNGMAESKPLPSAGRLLPETRILRSPTIEIQMQPDGREIETVSTHAPGTLEFLPNRQGQHHRQLEAERMWIHYGARNQIESFRAVEAKTRTDPTPQERNRAPMLTRSRNLSAQFEPATSQLTRMEQWDDFRYQEGERKASATHATLEARENRMALDGQARVWDATGSTSAERIRLDQQHDEFTAEGHVHSSRLPDKKEKGNTEMLSGDEPLQAVAESMHSSHRNRLIRYAGAVVLWQGANRLEAGRVDIDREQRQLAAARNVVTQFLDDSEENAPAVFTVVRAPQLLYTDQDRLAHYTGGVHLTRPRLEVQSQELRAFLAPSGEDSRLEKAVADGRVRIVDSAPGRTRTGTGEHAEYFAGEEKVILRGGEPQLADSSGGSTRGSELTYFANDDRLLVNGAPNRPITSRIRRRQTLSR